MEDGRVGRDSQERKALEVAPFKLEPNMGVIDFCLLTLYVVVVNNGKYMQILGI